MNCSENSQLQAKEVGNPHFNTITLHLEYPILIRLSIIHFFPFRLKSGKMFYGLLKIYICIQSNATPFLVFYLLFISIFISVNKVNLKVNVYFYHE